MSTFFVYAQGAADAYILSRDQMERHTEAELEVLLGGKGQHREAPDSNRHRQNGKPISAALSWRDLGLLAVVVTTWTSFLNAI